jgi:2'-5' RNA ligase
VRLFFALWPPRETALALERWAQPLEGRRTPADKIHLTLAFLGEADAQKALDAACRVQEAAFRLPLEEAGYWGRNEIVWVGPREAPGELVRLVENLQLELYKDSFILERRPFAAHVTLLRKAAAQSLPALPALPRIEWPAKEFALVRASGGSYETLERFPLG